MQMTLFCQRRRLSAASFLLPPLAVTSTSHEGNREARWRQQQATAARAQVRLFSAPRCPFGFFFSGGRGLVLIPGSRKQSLPSLLIYHNRGRSITESILNLTRIIGNDHWIQRETSKSILEGYISLIKWSYINHRVTTQHSHN